MMNPEPDHLQRSTAGWRRFPRSCYTCKHSRYASKKELQNGVPPYICTNLQFGTNANASCANWKEYEK